MSTSSRSEEASPAGRPVVFLLDEHGTVRRCGGAVTDLLGLGAGEIEGRPWSEVCAVEPSPGDGPDGPGDRQRSLVLRHRDGTPVEADAEVVPLPPGGPSGRLVLLTAAGPRGARTHAVLRGVFAQEAAGLVVDAPGPGGRVLLSPAFFGLDQPLGGDPWEGRLEDVLEADDAARLDACLRRVRETGEPFADPTVPARGRGLPGRERIVAVSAFPLEDHRDGTHGAAALLVDVTGRNADQRELTLLHASARRLGRSLDVTGAAQEVVRLLVEEGFADLACVDLTDPVRHGGDAGTFVPGTPLHRVAVASEDGSWPSDIHQLGDRVRARDVESEAIGGGGTAVVPDLALLRRRLDSDPERVRLLFPAEAASALFVPLFARGHVLGVLSAWRREGRTPYGDGDVPQVDAIASRTALSLDSARRYTRERRTVEELQRSLLPPPVSRTTAARSSGVLVPAGSAEGSGGSWFDVIRLSGARTAFVVGRVAGHGVHAAGAMGRLRSAVQTLADVDLPPDELLGHLNDLVTRMGGDEVHRPASFSGSLSAATCLYASYDPVTGLCRMATAGHPAPLLARRSTGGVTRVDVRPGPPLGSGDHQPFEAAQLSLEPGDVLAFHSGPSDAAPSDDAGDLRLVAESARAAAADDEPLEDVTGRLLHQLRARPRAEDLTLLLARVDRLPEEDFACWKLPADPDQVVRVRGLVTSQLARWGLEEASFTTELIVSELVTNAIRYAGGPIGVRLVKDERLICEVSDPSQSQPHLRRARLSDEGGRGLFLVAQMTDRWGSRYTPEGKTIWTEQTLAPPEAPPP
ncbi:SpoIIE family protein phosphatase [Streptomyces fragilis]|uniref:SpoIIE family protein phosphatase n=1 Tax=Streptomyces fragilis TaxID=67301 RepID=A0ABV2YRV3_9ACTN|nr:SpoIIE family protein phosphatase [Streptomyces fragilis]